MRRPTARMADPLVPLGLIVVVSLALGSQVSGLADVSLKTLVALAVAGPIGLFLCLNHPRWAVIGLAWVPLFGANTPLFSAGSLSVRMIDVPFALVVLWTLVRAAQGVRPLDIGQRAVFGLFFTLLVTTVPNLMRHPESTAYSFEALFRVAQSVASVMLVSRVLPRREDRQFVLRGVLLGCVAAVALPLAGIHGTGLFGNDRLSGFTSENSTGLVSVLAIVLAGRDATLRRPLRAGAVLIGLLGLLGTRSVGSLSSLGLVFSMYGLSGSTERQSVRSRNLIRPAKFAIGAVAIIGLVTTLRPGNLPTSDEFATSTTSHRVVLGYAGLEIFWHNPVIGVGWARSSLTEVIGAEEVVKSLAEKFDNVNPNFLPDVNPGSVHNLYIEFLAESGLVGIMALGLCAVAVRRRARRVLATSAGTDFVSKWTAYVGLVTILIWYNDNAVFGAQPESVLIGIFLGILAAPDLVSARADRPADAAVPVALVRPTEVSR